MHQNTMNFGICSTCNHKTDCMFLKNSLELGKTIYSCDDFDDSFNVPSEMMATRKIVCRLDRFTGDHFFELR